MSENHSWVLVKQASLAWRITAPTLRLERGDCRQVCPQRNLDRSRLTFHSIATRDFYPFQQCAKAKKKKKNTMLTSKGIRHNLFWRQMSDHGLEIDSHYTSSMFQCGNDVMMFYRNKAKKVKRLEIYWWKHRVGRLQKMGTSRST